MACLPVDLPGTQVFGRRETAYGITPSQHRSELTTRAKASSSWVTQWPPATNKREWIYWRSMQLPTRSWWHEFFRVPGAHDYQVLARKVQASFEATHPRVDTQGGVNDYGIPLSPRCLCLTNFLPAEDPQIQYSDYRGWQKSKTITYVHALQY